MADGEPTQQHDLAEIPQCQPKRSRQNTTNATMSLGNDARSRTPSLRSLNCVPQFRHRNRRYPCAVRSGGSVTAAEPQPTQSMAISPRPPAILGKLTPCAYPPREARGVTEPLLARCTSGPNPWVCGVHPPANRATIGVETIRP